MKTRISKQNYYLNIAEAVAGRSTCLKRQYGAIIVKNDVIISTGYNGAPRGIADCVELGECNRQNAARGTDYSNCKAVHAEMNAIIAVDRDKMLGSTMYLVGKQNETEADYVSDPKSCTLCRRLIINAGIKNVIVRLTKDTYEEYDVQDWVDNEDILGGY